MPDDVPPATATAEPEPEPPVEDTQVTAEPEEAATGEAADNEPPKRRCKAWAVIVWIVVVLALLCGAGYCVYRQYMYMQSVPRYYTLTDTALPPSGLLHRHTTSLPYGSELLVHEFGDTHRGMSKVTMSGKWMIGIPFYVPTELIMDSGDFRRLDSIWGDEWSKGIIVSAHCRRALLNYFKENGLSTEWKVYSRDTAEATNTTFFQRVVARDSELPDFAVIIENKRDTARRCLLFSFDGEKQPSLVFDKQAPQEGCIRLITNQEGEYTVHYDNADDTAAAMTEAGKDNVGGDAVRQNVKQDTRQASPDFQLIAF